MRCHANPTLQRGAARPTAIKPCGGQVRRAGAQGSCPLTRGSLATESALRSRQVRLWELAARKDVRTQRGAERWSRPTLESRGLGCSPDRVWNHSRPLGETLQLYMRGRLQALARRRAQSS